ncbi:MAG: RDD family protein [Ardenticatenales bacterium]
MDGEPNDGVLRSDYTVLTPESVAFGYPVAGIGSRFIGALVDTAALAGALGALLCGTIAFFAAIADGAPAAPSAPTADDLDIATFANGLILAVVLLVVFAIVWGYFIVFETLWDGQTPGKRVAGTRVVRLDGGAAGFREAVVRNLVRFADFLPMGYGMGVLVMFADRHARRLGDLAAGTVVIREQRQVTWADVAVSAPAEGEREAGAPPPPPVSTTAPPPNPPPTTP